MWVKPHWVETVTLMALDGRGNYITFLWQMMFDPMAKMVTTTSLAETHFPLDSKSPMGQVLRHCFLTVFTPSHDLCSILLIFHFYAAQPALFHKEVSFSSLLFPFLSESHSGLMGCILIWCIRSHYMTKVVIKLAPVSFRQSLITCRFLSFQTNIMSSLPCAVSFTLKGARFPFPGEWCAETKIWRQRLHTHYFYQWLD